MSGSRSPASSRRASATSTRCGPRSRSAGATTRSPSGSTAKAAETGREAQGRHSARRCGGRRWARRADGDRRASARADAGSAARPSIAQVFTRGRQGRARQRAGDRRGRSVVFRVTDTRCRRSTPRSPGGQGDRDAARAAPTPTTCSRNIVAQLQNELGATINADALRQAIGGSASQKPACTIETGRRGFRGALCARRAAGRLDHAGRRSRDAGLGLPEARRAAQPIELPARIGRGRRGARPLFDDRARAGPDLARRRTQVPRSTARARTEPDAFEPCPEPPLDALRALIAESRIVLPDEPAADGGRRVRLSRLRHGAADGGAAARPIPIRSACPTRS